MYSKLLIIAFPLLVMANNSSGQSDLNLVATYSKAESRFDLEVQPFALDQILEITGNKLAVKPTKLVYNNKQLQVKSCKTRGNTTLLYRRKSFSISLNERIDIDSAKVKRLNINNLAMDHNYWRARLCFILMKQIGIFSLKNQYTELTLNGQTQGIYLIIQKPEDYVRSLKGKLLVRRVYSKGVFMEFSDGSPDNKNLVKQLKDTWSLLKMLSGKQLFDSLNSKIYLDNYHKWLAFNYLILNGDYLDELFLFLGPDTKRFDIIPWDYDDIFASQPHEGMKKRNQMLGDRLLFSSESSLDLTIGNDTYLYSAYLNSFREVLNKLTPEVLKDVFEQVYKELHGFYMIPEVIAQSKYDQNGLTNINLLEEDLNHHFQFLLRRRSSIKDTILSQLQDLGTDANR